MEDIVRNVPSSQHQIYKIYHHLQDKQKSVDAFPAKRGICCSPV